jgi:hypothetical protein
MKYVYVAPHPLPRASNRLVALLTALALLVAALPVAVPLAQQVATSIAAQTPAFGALPLAFVPNHGQADPAVAMQVRGPQGTVSFTPHEVVFALPHAAAAVRLQFAGANATPTIGGADR